MIYVKRFLLLITICLLIITRIAGRQTVITPSVDQFLSDEWIHVNLSRGIDRVETVNGARVFSMERTVDDAYSANIAYLNNITLRNAIVECEVFSPVEKGQISFIGFLFRAKDASQYECVYFRPFVSDTTGAIEYVPVIHEGMVNWPDYRAAAYKAKATAPEQRWFHIMLEIIDAELKVYIDHATQPQMVINTLALGTRDGKIGFWLGNSKKVYFKNLKITRLD